MPKLLYKQANCEIFWDDRDHWLYANWIGYQSVEEVKRDCEQMLKLMESKGADAVLNDNTLVEGIWIGAAEWGAKDWFPRMRKAGLQYFAWVYSPSRFSQLSTDATLAMSVPGTAQVFWSIEDAVNWLRAQRERTVPRTQRIQLPLRINTSS